MFHQIDEFFLNSSTGSEVSQDHPYQRSPVWSDHEVWRWEAGVHAARQKPSPGLAHGVQSQVISFLLQGGAPLLGILPGQFSLFLIKIFLQLEAILCQKGAITFSCIFFQGIVLPEAYTKPGAECIECLECGGLFSPQKFVCHSHSPQNRICHWGFDSANWRHYIQVTHLLQSPDLHGAFLHAL